MSGAGELSGDVWAIVELMGHKRYAGRVREVTIAGGAFLRVDVPEGGDFAASTHYFGPAAIYGLHPTTEEIARRAAHAERPEPVSRYDLLPRGLPAPGGALYRWASEVKVAGVVERIDEDGNAWIRAGAQPAAASAADEGDAEVAMPDEEDPVDDLDMGDEFPEDDAQLEPLDHPEPVPARRFPGAL
jgi:hypothetical protein